MKKNLILDVSKAIEANDFGMLKSIFDENPEVVAHNDGALGTWLHKAALFSSVEMLGFMLGYGININSEAENSTKETPLALAISSGRIDIIKELLRLGADPNFHADYSRQTLRAVTTKRGNGLEILKVLVDKGADIHREFINESTGEPINALSLAKDWGKKEIEEYLIANGCKMPTIKNIQASFRSHNEDGDVLEFFEKEFGPVSKKCLVEIVPTDPPITICFVGSDESRPFITLFTIGMSRQSMKVPKGGDKEYQFSELFIQLPKNWDYENLEDSESVWPIDWLLWLAKFPHKFRTWLGGPVAIIAKEDPPAPIAPSLNFTSMLAIAEKKVVCSKKKILQARKIIQLYRLFPLYSEERDLEIQQGIPALMVAFDRANISFIFDRNRRNVGI